MGEEKFEMRKTRFVCISDTHNATANGSFKLPKGDVLIHAGDLTNQGSFKELQRTVKWIEDADYELKIVIAGNHDITLDTPFYSEYGLYFHNQDPQDVVKCQELLELSPKILYLKHEAAVINLSAPEGPRTRFKIFGSPYSPACGKWAFGYGESEAAQLWSKIPLDTDILITHTPPKYHCDERGDRRAVGCEALRCMLWRVRPRLAICGHVHESRGAEVIRWDLGMSNIKYKEDGVERWSDPGKDNKKISLVDLTRKGGRPIANDGSFGEEIFDTPGDMEQIDAGNSNKGKARRSFLALNQTNKDVIPPVLAPKSQTAVQKGLLQVANSLLAVPTGSLPPATRGQGGIPPSGRCDLEALSGRLGREQTCIVNAAIMASSWPHQGTGGKKFNKPIVVDIDLPVGESEL